MCSARRRRSLRRTGTSWMDETMECSFVVPADRPSMFVDPDGPALTTELPVIWESRSVPITVSALVDTGSPYDLLASPELAEEIRRTEAPTRNGTIDWRGAMECEFYRGAVKIGEWISVEVAAPIHDEVENLLGLPVLMRSRLCIRGLDHSAFWVEAPAIPGTKDWMAADREPAGANRLGARARHGSAREGRERRG